jgi:hypothetical protein
VWEGSSDLQWAGVFKTGDRIRLLHMQSHENRNVTLKIEQFLGQVLNWSINV